MRILLLEREQLNHSSRLNAVEQKSITTESNKPFVPEPSKQTKRDIQNIFNELDATNRRLRKIESNLSGNEKELPHVLNDRLQNIECKLSENNTKIASQHKESHDLKALIHLTAEKLDNDTSSITHFLEGLDANLSSLNEHFLKGKGP